MQQGYGGLGSLSGRSKPLLAAVCNPAHQICATWGFIQYQHLDKLYLCLEIWPSIALQAIDQVFTVPTDSHATTGRSENS